MLNYKKIFNLIIIALISLQAFSAIWFATPVQAANSNAIIISEIKWGGSSASVNDAWIELYNRSNGAINLSNWKLSGASLDGRDIILSGTINPNQFFLISRFNLQNPSTILNITPDFITNITKDPKLHLKSICYSNIVLRNSHGNLIDIVGCKNNHWAAGSAKASMERGVGGDQLGTLASWYTSVSHVNLDHVSPKNYASPKFKNDITPPTTGFILDGDSLSSDIEFHNNRHYVPVIFGGFFDPQTSISHFKVGLGTKPGLDDAIPFSVTTKRQLSLIAPSPLQHGKKYYATVFAFNGAGARSNQAVSNGVVIDVAKPLPPTNVKAVDTPNDKGTAIDVSWNRSTSIDLVTYTILYKEVGGVAYNTISGINNSGYRLNNLIAGKEYEIKVRAVDFSTRKSADILANPSAVLTVNNVSLTPSPITKIVKDTADVINKVILSSTNSGQNASKDKIATPTRSTVTNVPTGTSQEGNDWLRISIVAILLLIIASGFYALSRAYGENDKAESPKPLLIKKQKTSAVKSKKLTKRKRK